MGAYECTWSFGLSWLSRCYVSPVLYFTHLTPGEGIIWDSKFTLFLWRESFQRAGFITGQNFASQSMTFVILLFAGYTQCIVPGISIAFCFLLSRWVSYLGLPFRSSNTCWASVIGDLLVWDGAQTPTSFSGKTSLVRFLLSGSLEFCSAVNKSWCL